MPLPIGRPDIPSLTVDDHRCRQEPHYSRLGSTAMNPQQVPTFNKYITSYAYRLYSQFAC